MKDVAFEVKDVVILNGARTAQAEYAGTPGFGAFKDLSCTDLGAIAAKAALEKSNVKPQMIDHVVIGLAMQPSIDALYCARHIGLKAGVPIEVPGLTVNRICASSIESTAIGARFIMLGEANFVLAGGTESMSQMPYVVRGLRGTTLRFGASLKLEDSLFASLLDPYCGLFMAQTAEKLSRQYGITRQQQDEFAYRSHTEGTRAVKEGIFKQEIVPVKVKKGKQEIMFDTDDHIKPDTTLEKLAKLPAAFGPEGTVTAGNASGIVDSACCLVLASEKVAKQEGLPAIAKIRAYSVAGVDPSIMGIGPAPAIRKLLNVAGLKLEDIDLFEINEAFAAQYLPVEKELGLDRNKVNVNGGAIALGHPLGATGARLTLTLIYELRRRKKKLGIASACIGGGQGAAILVEAL
jgi:acetyl-CoA acetyltransferase family protein